MPAFAGMTTKRQFLHARATTTASRTRTGAATGCSAKAFIRRVPTAPRLVSARRVRVMALAMRYAELDVTTNFSFLRGGSHAEELVATAKALGLGPSPSPIATRSRAWCAPIWPQARWAASNSSSARGSICKTRRACSPIRETAPPTAGSAGLLTSASAAPRKGNARSYLEDVAPHAEGLIFIALPPDDWKLTTSPLSSPVLTGRSGNHGPLMKAQPQQDNKDQRLLDARFRGHDNRAEIIAFPPHPVPRGERGRCGATADSNPSPLVGEGGDPDLELGVPGEGVQANSFESELRRIKQALHAPARTHLYLAARHAYRGDDRARIEAVAQLAERVRLPLVATNDVLYHAPTAGPCRTCSPASARRCTIARGRLPARGQCRAPSESARRKWRGCSRGHADALPARSRSPSAAAFSLDELRYEYPDEPVPPGKTRAAASGGSDLGGRGAALSRTASRRRCARRSRRNSR